MSSLRHLRELISERLTAAAEEIFTHVENIIVEYEGEVDRQRKLLEIVSKPRVRLQRIELPQQHAENEQQLCNQEWNSSPDQEKPESLQIKGALKEICTSQEQEHLQIKEEADSLRNITEPPQQHVYNQEEVFTEQQLWNQEWNSILDQEEPKSLQIKEDEGEICTSQEQFKLKEEADTFMVIPDNEEGDHMEPDTDNQFLSPAAESQDQTVHMRNITGEKPHMCSFCDKCFRWKYSLIRHVRIHTGEKPHICDICKKCFVHKSSLVYHMRTHTGEKPHICDICKKCFVHKSSLMYHMTTHTGRKPHMCDICQKCFAHRPSFVYHMRTHTGEKPHMCNICEKRFVHKSSLVYHMRTHTAEKPYTTAAPAERNLVT